MKKFIIKAFLLIVISILNTGCPLPPYPDPSMRRSHISYVDIVEFNDSTYADYILAYRASVPHMPGKKTRQMVVNTNVLPGGFLDHSYNPWENIMGDFFTILPFSGSYYSDQTLWPLIGNGHIEELYVLSTPWIDFSQGNYSIGYDNYYDDNGTYHSTEVVQLSSDSLMKSYPVKAVYRLDMDTVYNYYQLEPCFDSKASALYCTYIRQMFMEFMEEGRLKEFLDSYKVYPSLKFPDATNKLEDILNSHDINR